MRVRLPSLLIGLVVLAVGALGLVWLRTSEDPERLRFGPPLTSETLIPLLAPLSGAERLQRANLELDRRVAAGDGGPAVLNPSARLLHLLHHREAVLGLEGFQSDDPAARTELAQLAEAYAAIGLGEWSGFLHAAAVDPTGDTQRQRRLWLGMWRPDISQARQIAFLDLHLTAILTAP